MGENADVLTVTHPGGEYNVYVGDGLLGRLRELAGVDGRIALITDSNVGPLYAQAIPEAACVVTMPAGEQNKTLATVNGMYEQLLAAGMDRSSTVVALGGGVVGDVAGFVAATYMRGINFVQCPTSLLAMVDASVGGKTGVDLPQGKNLVGAFKQPTAVLADIATLQTLPLEEVSAGMAEVIKHGLVGDVDLFERLEVGDSLADFRSLVTRAIRVKQVVVQEDPFEYGRRATLNLGHTFGHAIEQVSQYRIRHGEGVAMGLVAAANLSARLGHCPVSLPERIETALRHVNLPVRIPADLPPQAQYRAMFSDKKKAAGKLRFILLRDVGDVFVAEDVPETAVMETLVTVQADSTVKIK